MVFGGDGGICIGRGLSMPFVCRFFDDEKGEDEERDAEGEDYVEEQLPGVASC